ncbi:MAG: glycosyltransferase [Nitrosomonas ureae]
MIHEALAARTPVIATDLGGMADLIQHERNGLLFRRGDDNDLAEQIRRFVVDPGLLSRLGDHAHAVRSIEDEVAALEILYQNVYRTRRGYSDTN